MKGFTTLIFIILVAGCVIGAFFAYKSFKLRSEVKSWKGYHDGVLSKLNELQKDYAQISVYADDNKKLLAETTLEERKKMTVLYGASITKNWDTDKAFPGKHVINRGIGSQSDTQLLARFSSDVLSLNPGQVVIKFCSGNFQPEAKFNAMWDEYEIMAKTAARRGIAPILATVIPATRGAEQYDGYNVAGHIREFNDKIRKFAGENHFTVADYYKAMADKDGYLPDSMAKDTIHPNAAGYEKMTEVLRPLLK